MRSFARHVRENGQLIFRSGGERKTLLLSGKTVLSDVAGNVETKRNSRSLF